MRNFIKVFLLLFVFQLILSCSIFESEDYVDQSHIDFLVGVEESGKLKKELHFSGSDDETVGSDIEFIYKNDRLIKKIYTDYNWNSPYVLQKDTFIYKADILSQMVHYFRTGSPTSPLVVSKIYDYYYPDTDTKIEVIHHETGELKDSVVYIYSGKLLVEKSHYNHLGTWGSKYEYNSEGKLYKSTNLEGENAIINYFDENGVLKSSAGYDGDRLRTMTTYERKTNGNQLIIKKYIKGTDINSVEPFLTSHKKFENGKLIESVKYHPTFPGSEWWCTRYEYF